MTTTYVREIPEYSFDGLPLGRHVEHDERSRDYAFAVPEKLRGQPLQSVRHQRTIPILDQGNTRSCTGNAAEGVAGTMPVFQAIPAQLAAKPDPADAAGDEARALALYSIATQLDGIPGNYRPDDTGSTGLAVAKAMVQAGLIAGYQHTFSFQDALSALQVVPLMFGINWYDSFDQPSANGQIAITAGAQVRGGHEIEADELDVSNQRVWFDQSWSTLFGLDGRVWISWSDLERLLAEQGDVIVPVPLSQPKPQPAPGPAPAPAPGPAPTPLEDLERQMWTIFQTWAKAHGLA